MLRQNIDIMGGYTKKLIHALIFDLGGSTLDKFGFASCTLLKYSLIPNFGRKCEYYSVPKNKKKDKHQIFPKEEVFWISSNWQHVAYKNTTLCQIYSQIKHN